MRKGTLVKIRPHLPGHSWSPRPDVWRHITQAEIDAWYDSPRSKGMNSAGETKLAPREAPVKYEDGDTWTIVKSRCAPILFHRKTPKCALIFNNRTNETGYIRRINLEIV
jgi:hypothetical protein